MKIETLPVLVLNPHSRCNCRCTMCDIWKTSGVQELSEAEVRRLIDSIRLLRVEWVVLSGGEPMMHSNLWRLCSVLRQEDLRITLLSSGLLLGRHASSIVKQIDDVIVSLDGPREVHDTIRGMRGAFDLLADGVGEIRKLQPGFAISARSTVQSANFRYLRETAEAARNLGLDSISFLAADVESAAFRRPNGWPLEKQRQVALDTADMADLDAEIEALIGRGQCGAFVAESPEKLRRIARHFRAYLGDEEAVAPICNAPWTSAVVDADGAVRPCFFHPAVGHLNSGLALSEIVNGTRAAAFRDSLDVATNPICRRCVCSLNWKSAKPAVPAAQVQA